MLIFALGSVAAFGQRKTCDLKLKVFSYDSLKGPKARLINVTAQLKGKNGKSAALTGDGADGFEGLAPGKHRIEFQKTGFKTRVREIDLNCDLADDKNRVWSYTHLWRDEKVAFNDLDLVSDNAQGDGSSDRKAPAEGKIFGKVTVKVLIDVDGNVISASRIDGVKELADRAIRLARQAKFSPTLINGEAFQVTGSLVYNFVP
jgi:hypothetical protein